MSTFTLVYPKIASGLHIPGGPVDDEDVDDEEPIQLGSSGRQCTWVSPAAVR